jgi:homoserine O-acetyltransferase/O-succinyltransferase
MLKLFVLLAAAVLAAPHTQSPSPVEGDFIIRNFRFMSGEVLPELRMHYRTLGTPRKDALGTVRNAVLIMHGTGGSGAQFMSANFAGELFGPGQPLDITRYYVILPDDIGHGGSSKPSNGLRAKFPRYGYADMVEAEHRLVTEGLGVNHLRLVMGTSMGGMHTWLWASRYPEMADAWMPLASLPTQISGRNRAWRRVVIDAIRNDPEWKQGSYTAQPPSLRTAAEMLWLMSSNPILRQQKAATVADTDRVLDQYVADYLKTGDANDVLYALEASRDYDPGPGLERIVAPLLAINSADDLINPPELQILEREIRRVPNGRAIVLPLSDKTAGHGTHTLAAVWKHHLEQLLRDTEPKPLQPPQRLIAIFVVDGLRPDSITVTDTPVIASLRAQGVEYTNSHSIFPTSTRVNAAALSTGTYPARHGIVGNSMFVPGVNAAAPFDTGDYEQLLKLEAADGRSVTTETLGEVLQRSGRKLVTVSSGTTGNGFLLNPQAGHGAGVVIHGLFAPGVTSAYPKEISDVIIKRFGSPPPDPDDVGQMRWTDTVLRDYVLPELRPDVIIDWMGPLDAAQHAHGVGSPQAKEALRHIDESLGRTLTEIDRLGRSADTNVIIVSDHGFARHAEGANVTQALVAAGLKKDASSTDIVVASQGQSMLFYVPDKSAGTIERLVAFLQRQRWVGVIFTRGGSGGQGSVPGTFSLDMIRAGHAVRAADVAITLAWSDGRNAFGVPGSQTIDSAKTGRLTGAASGHGGLSPWVVRNTFIATGPDFRIRARAEAPASLADVMPTVLSIFGVEPAACPEGGCGRVLREALRQGPPQWPATPTRRVLRTRAGAFRASLQISTVDGHDYVDSGRRER